MKILKWIPISCFFLLFGGLLYLNIVWAEPPAPSIPKNEADSNFSIHLEATGDFGNQAHFRILRVNSKKLRRAWVILQGNGSINPPHVGPPMTSMVILSQEQIP